MLSAETYSTITIDRHEDGVILATIDRPERLNAVDSVLHSEMARLPREADADPNVKVLVITGAGKHFCVGADMKESPAPDLSPGSAMMLESTQIIEHLLSCETPIISVVRGYALGLGANFALLADVVFAGESAVFADTHVNIGVGAGDGGQLIWPALIGVNRAKYYLMSGDKLPAREAERIGLVNFVLEDDVVLAEALALARRWASGPIQAIKASKAGINAYLRLLNSFVMPVGLMAEQLTLESDDRKEAKAAFLEKRTPVYTGH